jgi:hypothetical protein
MNIFNIERSFRQKKERNWQRLYWLIDLHDTVSPGKYNKFNVGREFYPHAQEVLSYLTSREDMKLLLWTSSHMEAVHDILPWLEQHNIRFDAINENPFEPIETQLCDFSQKPYFNIILDDKAGFEGATDWGFIKKELRRLEEWPLPRVFKIKEPNWFDDSFYALGVDDSYPYYGDFLKTRVEEWIASVGGTIVK